MNSYTTSDGNRVTKKEIDKRTTAAKKQVIQDQLNDVGYIVCQVCFKNDCVPVDCAHTVSVNEAQNTGRAELCWSTKNIILTGRDCHNKQDGTAIQYTNDL